MSGEGLLPNADHAHAAMMRAAEPSPVRRSADEERADTLAYFDRKIGNAAKMIARSSEFADAAAASKRAWEIARDDIRGGLHIGEATLAADEPEETN